MAMVTKEKPSKDELQKLIEDKGYRYAGKKYGVSDNTARRWAMAYGLTLVPKCKLKSRDRQGMQKVGDSFIYDKHINNTPKEKKEYIRKKTTVSSSSVNNVPSVPKVKKVVKKREKRQFTLPQIDTRPKVENKPTDELPVKISNKRYSQSELDEFSSIIESKIQEGFEAICSLKENLSRVKNGANDTLSVESAFENQGSSIEVENISELVVKKQEHLNELSAALQRVGSGSYGVCVATGVLIPKEKLLATPQATKCVEDTVVTPEETVVSEEEVKTVIKSNFP